MTFDPGRLADVHDRIESACDRVGRSSSDVTLVAVTKSWPVDVVDQAASAGVTDIGENRAQELSEKLAVIGGRVRWHFIGPLQTNKVRHVVGNCALVHSVDRYGLGEAIARRARSLDAVQDVLIEVNIAGEPSKAGVEPARALELARELDGLEGLDVGGLMAIPPQTDDPKVTRSYFKELWDLGEALRGSLPAARHLSMGMSRDFEIAVEEGATLVRVGSAIFGPRRR